jgi:glyoxylase-like metal-dependent hydrolase (beta-lactamase superfamily II)
MKLFFHYVFSGFSNTYLLGPDRGGDAILVDPGILDLKLINYIEKNDFYVRAILVTHNHDNHVNGIRSVKKIYDAQVFSSNASVLGYPCNVVHDGDKRSICGMDVEIHSVPGHSPDSIVYKIGHVLFVGDTLSAGLCGKTQSSFGERILIERLRERILSQNDSCVILPGHGPPSTVGAEKIANRSLSSDKVRLSRERLLL